MAINQPDITEGEVTHINFERIATGTPPIRVHLIGQVKDANGGSKEEHKFYDWDELPQAWQNALLPTLKLISKEYNNVFADEDTETL